MPELPEVETYRRDLAEQLVLRAVARAEIRQIPNAHRIFRRHGPAGFSRAVTGARITGVGRLGKFMYLELDRPHVLVIHLGMSGRLEFAVSLDPFRPHSHVALDLDDGRQLRYLDPRAFGEMFVSAVEHGIPADLAHLGVDPLTGWPSYEEFSAMLDSHQAMIKPLLMNQTFIAGLGNIYTDEALHAAAIRFDRPAASLSPVERRKLHESVPRILARSIELRGTSMVDEAYRDLGGALGGFQKELTVYARQHEPCPGCGRPIERGRWGSRSTFYCPACQK